MKDNPSLQGTLVQYQYFKKNFSFSLLFLDENILTVTNKTGMFSVWQKTLQSLIWDQSHTQCFNVQLQITVLAITLYFPPHCANALPNKNIR